MSKEEREQRADDFMKVLSLLSDAWSKLDDLAVGDYSTKPGEIKHSLDGPIQAVRNYATEIYLGHAQGYWEREE